MANPLRYATLEALQARLTERVTETAELVSRLDAASTTIEQYCDRVFTLDTAATARTFYCTDGLTVIVDDIGSTTSLAVTTGTDGTFPTDVTSLVWYDPQNALAQDKPITAVKAMWYTFPVMRRPTVQVTALWGWPSVPADITEAVLIYASRLQSRKASPTGVAGFGEYGVVRLSRTDPDVAAMADNYVRHAL